MVQDHFAGTLSELDRQVVDFVPPGGNWRDLPEDFESKRIQQIRASAARGEGSRSTYYGRLREDRPSYTISTYFSRPGNGCYIHYRAPRLITVREAARLQGFPDTFRFLGPGRARFMQVGNAVPPILAYQVASMLPRGQVVDLFAGVGGLSLGFSLAGFDLIAAVDNDKYASAAHELNFGADAAVLTDLGDPEEQRRAIRAIQTRRDRQSPLVLVGGPPCQGFSTAGRCALDDPRNRLVYSFLNAVESLRPQALVMENVPALMQRRGNGVLEEIRSALAKFGYATSVAILHAESYGVPQLRRRLFILGSLEVDHLRWPRPWLTPLRPGNFAHQPGLENRIGLREPISVAEAIDDLPLETVADKDAAIAYATPPRSDYQRWARGILPMSELVPPSGISFPTDTPRLFGAPA